MTDPTLAWQQPASGIMQPQTLTAAASYPVAEQVNQSINIRLFIGRKRSYHTCLAPDWFKKSISGPWPKKVVHHWFSESYFSTNGTMLKQTNHHLLAICRPYTV